MENKDFSDLSINCQQNGAKTAGNTSSNVSSEEIDRETIDKLRGDAIGDTMYSQSSVIRILLQLSDVKWDKKLEEDLCFLWDITVEGDVCEYLYHLSFPSIATAILLKYSEPRLIEIIIGILGNICSNSEIVADITDVEISIVLNAMETDDHLILIQIMRFLSAITYHRNGRLCFITSDVIEKICFILTNSTNKQLLVQTMETLSKIMADFKIEVELLNKDILVSLLIAYDYIKKETKDSTDLEEEVIEMNKILNVFIQTVLNISLYVNQFPKSGIYKEIISKNDDLLQQFRTIIKKFTRQEDLLPLTEEIKFYFESFTIIFPILSLKYDADIFRYLFKITDIVINDVTNDDTDSFIELMRYVISVSDVDNLVKDVEKVKCKDKCALFKIVLEHKSKCEFNYKENSNVIIEKLNEMNK